MNTAATPPASAQVRAIALIYGVVCHGAFVAGVATMIYAMFFGMSRCVGTLALPWGLAADALLLLQFPLAHSFLLGRRGRAILVRLAPPALGARLVTTTYVILASVQTLLLFSVWTPSGIVWWRATGASLVGLVGLYTAAWLLLLKSILDAGIGLQTGWIGWWAVLRNRLPTYPPMPARGLFRLVRQPIYVAFALTLWTVPTWTPDQLAVALVLTAYCVVGPLFKEVRFRRVFGRRFAAYRRRVPYWLPTGRPARRPTRIAVSPAAAAPLNDLSIYGTYAPDWWTGRYRWLRTLQNLVPARLAFFDRLAGDWHGRRVLDLGCGGGFMAEALARRGARVTGVDPAAAALAIARDHAGDQALCIDYLAGVGEALPARDATFDMVVCVDVLEHVADVGTVVAEVHRVLRPGGVFLFDTINRTRLARLVMVVCGERLFRLLPRGTHDPQKFIRPSELEAQLTAGGFAPPSMAGLGPRGLDRHGDFVFGALPTRAIMYMGGARKMSHPAPAAAPPSGRA